MGVSLLTIDLRTPDHGLPGCSRTCTYLAVSVVVIDDQKVQIMFRMTQSSERYRVPPASDNTYITVEKSGVLAASIALVRSSVRGCLL